MRRPRHKLQVSTFPFLAVLLCAMGSLVFLLLVMDRRAKVVARHKAMEAVAARRAGSGERRAQAEAERRAEWERQRDQLHQTLAQQERELREHLSGLVGEIRATEQHVEKHHTNYLSLQEQLAREAALLRTEKERLDLQKSAMSDPSKQDLATRTELERLTLELLQMERTLRDLRDLKNRPVEAYSLVPYRGRHGDSRKPIYVECNNDALVFHPGGTVVENYTMTPLQIRSEVMRRAGKLTRLADEDTEVRTPLKNQNAYILFLVRPDGIENYYKAQSALRGYAIDYGYELIEAYWAFDFGGDGRPGRQVVNHEAGGSHWSKTPLARGGSSALFSSSSFSPPPRTGEGPPGTTGGSSGAGDGVPGTGGEPGQHALGSSGAGGGPYGPLRRGPAGAGIPGGSTLTTSLGPTNGGGGPSGLPSMSSLPSTPPIGVSLGVPQSGAPGASTREPLPDARVSVNESEPRPSGSGASAPTKLTSRQGSDEQGSPGSFSVLAPVLPPSGIATGESGGQPGRIMSGAPGTSAAQKADGGTPSSGSGTPGPANPQIGPQASIPAPGQRFTDRKPQGEQAQQGEPGERSDGSEGTVPNLPTGSNRPTGAKGVRGGGSPGSSLWLGGTSSDSARSAPQTLGKLLSNHDFIINLECVAEGVVIYPRNELYPMSPAANQTNVEAALVQAIQQLIARRQATVRRGETPYRPIIRLQILPEGRRAYYWIYPVLEGLRIPMIRENVDE